MHLAELASIGEILTGCAAVAALVIAGSQIRLTREIARQERVYSYLDRINNRDFLADLTETLGFLRIPPKKSADERWEEWLSMPFRERQRLLVPLNAYEELATMYNAGMLDRGLARLLFRASSLAYWEVAAWLVMRYRTEQENPRLLAEWEKMNGDLERDK